MSIAHATPRLAVLLSGGGRTMVNLDDRIRAGSLRASIVLVIASRECPGAALARDRGLEVRVMPGVIPAPALESLLHHFDVDWVVLAGYLKMVDIPGSYAGRIVNIHPSLLPLHGGPGMYGHRVHKSVLAAGDSESGCTVHLCDSAFDTGPVVVQKRCPVLPGDTPDTLATRVFALETEAYPEALQLLFSRPVHS